MPTPRKATYDDVNRAIYDLSEEKVLDRVNIHDEIVKQLEAAVLILENHPGVSVDTSGFKATLARATGEKTK